MSNSANIDYFFVVARTENKSANFSLPFPQRNGKLRLIVSVENTGHFDADVTVAGQIMQPNCGSTFTNGQMEWRAPIPDLKRNEVREQWETVDINNAKTGKEHLRVGIHEYVDLYRSSTCRPLENLPISITVDLLSCVGFTIIRKKSA